MPLDHTDLREMKKRHDVEGLLGILETGDIKECRESIRMLGELRNRKAILPLIGFLETDDIQIRSNAAWALGEIGHVKAVLPLIGILDDPIENVRINAAWSLGRIGDKRALSALRSAMRNGSTELRKHAREAIAKIDSTEADKRHGLEEEQEESDFSDIAIPLLTLTVPPDMECNYLSRVEDEVSQTDFVNTTQFSRDVLLNDTGNYNVIPDDELRKVILGLSKGSIGSVSIDILFRFKNDNGDNKTSSVWLHVLTKDKKRITGAYKVETIPELERREPKRRVSDTGKRKTRIVKKAKPVEYEIQQDFEIDREESIYEDIEEPEEYPGEKVLPRKEIKRQYKKFPVRERQVESEPYSRGGEEFEETQEPGYREVYEQPGPEITPSESKPEIKTEVKPVKEPVKPAAKKSEPSRAQVKTSELKPISELKPEIKPLKEYAQPVAKIPETPKPEIKAPEAKPELKTEPVREPVKIAAKPEIKAEVMPEAKPQLMPEIVPPRMKQGVAGAGDVDSAVRLLSDIGMSGMTKAASAVTQLSGEEEEAKHSQLRTLPVDELKDEILSLGNNVVMISVVLNGKGPSGDVNGEMQIYISKQDALDVANELLCNPPDAHEKEFTDDISSTLKEIANIFGGQYVSAISEYIGVPFLLNVPTFKTGQSSQIAESSLKDIGGKVDFVLATNLAFGPTKVGRLIMLLDPASFETIIKKLF